MKNIIGWILVSLPMAMWIWGAIDTMSKQTGWSWFYDHRIRAGKGSFCLVIVIVLTAYLIVVGKLIQ